MENARDEIEMKSLINNDDDDDSILDEDVAEDIVDPTVAPFTPGSTKGSHGHGHGDAAPRTASKQKVAANIFISFVGAGILGLPSAFSKGGWVLSSLITAGVCFLSVKAMLLLIETRKVLEGKGHTEVEGYGDVGRIVSGSRGENLVNLFLVISQTGFATAYIIFISRNLLSVFGLPTFVTALCVIPFLSYLVNLRSMSRLAPFSLFADFANILGLFVVFCQDVSYLPLNDDHITPFNFSYLLYVTSVTVYCFEGVGLILPLESSSVDRQGFPRLLSTVLASITCLMVFFGTLGYMGFGASTLSPITLNLQGPFAVLVKLSLCTGLYLTYPVMMFPVNTVLEETFSIDSSRSFRFRVMVVIGTSFIAWSVPDFGVFIAFVGASICMILGFVMPAYFHLKALGDQATPKEKMADYGLILFGCVMGFLGTLESGKDLIDVVVFGKDASAEI